MSSQLVSSVLVSMSQISLLVSQSANFASAGFAADFGAAVSAGFASAGFAEPPGSALFRGGNNRADRRLPSTIFLQQPHP